MAQNRNGTFSSLKLHIPKTKEQPSERLSLENHTIWQSYSNNNILLFVICYPYLPCRFAQIPESTNGGVIILALKKKVKKQLLELIYF